MSGNSLVFTFCVAFLGFMMNFISHKILRVVCYQCAKTACIITFHCVAICLFGIAFCDDFVDKWFPYCTFKTKLSFAVHNG